jgi:hypothetical protein
VDDANGFPFPNARRPQGLRQGHASSAHDVVAFAGALLEALAVETAACNALHQLEERMARWLLQALDRTGSPNLPLTQELISRMLAVRRSTVTVIAGKLQQAGLIRYHRGHIEIVDRLKLEEAACECYGTIRRRTDAVFHTPQSTLN